VDALTVPAQRPIATALCLAAAFWAGTSHAGPSLEYGIKAAYLSKFAAFVEWPDKTFAAADSPINVCVAGADPFGSTLEQVAAGQRVGGHPIEIRRLSAIAAGSGCQIAFLGGSGEQSVAQAIAAVHGEAILTVTDAAADPHDRGIVSFVIVNDRVRFEIDNAAAEQNHVVISSKLLSLAVAVKGAP
jgi:hypothetical protein